LFAHLRAAQKSREAAEWELEEDASARARAQRPAAGHGRWPVKGQDGARAQPSRQSVLRKRVPGASASRPMRGGAALPWPSSAAELATGVYGRAGHRLHADTCHPWTAPVAGQSQTRNRKVGRPESSSRERRLADEMAGHMMRSVVLQPPPPRFAGILRFAGVSDWASQDLVPIVGALLRSLFNIIRLVPRSRRVSSGGSSSSTKPQMGRTASFIDRVRRPRPMHDAAVS